MIAWWNASFGEEEASAVYNAVKSNYLNEGVLTRKFEEEIGKELNSKFVKAVPSGTVALSLALWALGIEHGDEVIIPNTTFMGTASAVQMTGAIPILTDVNKHDFNVNIEEVKKKISKKTKAIILVHINGRSCDIDSFLKLRKETGIPIIEDTAQGLGSRDAGRYLGTIFDVGCISLAPSKVISTGQGGLILTQESEIHDKIIRLKDHGRMKRTEKFHPEPGFNFKFTDLQAAIGLEQLKKLKERLNKAISDYRFYSDKLNNLSGIRIIPMDFQKGNVPLWIDTWVDDRDSLIQFLNSKEIFPQPFWEPLHKQWINDPGEFSISSEVNSHGLWLPSGPVSKIEDLETVSQYIKQFYS